MEKRKRKKEEFRSQQKKTKFDNSIDYKTMTDDDIFTKYKRIYPDREDEQTKNYIRYQRLIHETKFKHKKK